jgi:hypothetical protein
MKSPPQVFNMHIPIPMPVFLELCDHREKTGCKQEIFEMAGAAVREWIAAQERKSTQSSSPPPLNGYQWKDAYLPSGTILRTVYKRQTHHAIVEGDSIIFDRRSVSPSEFANAFGGAVRNAWKVIWVLLPGESDWKLASTLRQRIR